VNAFASIGLYHASKWALEAFSQSLSQEVGQFGIHVTLVEPGGFSTDWAGPSAKVSKPMEVYEPVRAAMAERRSRSVAGDPQATGPAMSRTAGSENRSGAYFWVREHRKHREPPFAGRPHLNISMPQR
ncbi:SDR family NAD(P)-dependent oxidoreductase, partial [Mesorhizobium sp.]|uniref:SDR family NAD(P)-dependent oxidoreductase n=1 Tax=Mesorhizobium sp. TaxID=1871066 RepID=UPI000FE71B5A